MSDLRVIVCVSVCFNIYIHVSYYYLVSNLFAQSYLWEQKSFHFYFTKTTNKPVYRNTSVYSNSSDVYIILPCLSKNRLWTNVFRLDLFSIFTIKMLRALVALAPLLGLFIIKTLTNVLLTMHYIRHVRWGHVRVPVVLSTDSK